MRTPLILSLLAVLGGLAYFSQHDGDGDGDTRLPGPTMVDVGGTKRPLPDLRQPTTTKGPGVDAARVGDGPRIEDLPDEIASTLRRFRDRDHNAADMSGATIDELWALRDRIGPHLEELTELFLSIPIPGTIEDQRLRNALCFLLTQQGHDTFDSAAATRLAEHALRSDSLLWETDHAFLVYAVRSSDNPDLAGIIAEALETALSSEELPSGRAGKLRDTLAGIARPKDLKRFDSLDSNLQEAIMRQDRDSMVADALRGLAGKPMLHLPALDRIDLFAVLAHHPNEGAIEAILKGILEETDAKIRLFLVRTVRSWGHGLTVNFGPWNTEGSYVLGDEVGAHLEMDLGRRPGFNFINHYGLDTEENTRKTVGALETASTRETDIDVLKEVIEALGRYEDPSSKAFVESHASHPNALIRATVEQVLTYFNE